MRGCKTDWVTELGDLLELLHGAQAPFTTVRGTFRTWTDQERATAAFRAMAEGRGRAAMVMVHRGARQSPRERVEVVRIWRAPERARVERDDDGGRFGVRVGDRWWWWNAELGAVSNERDAEVGSGVGGELRPLLDPTLLLGALRFAITGAGEVAGRQTITVDAVPRGLERNWRSVPDHFALHELGGGAERYLLEFDAERGVVLRVEALREGDIFRRTEAVGIAFDEHLDEELFVFRAPPGESVHSPRELHSHPEHVPITEAQRRAPFTVLMPARVPAGWQASCTYFGPSERPPLGARVQLSYRSESAHEDVAISQRTVGDSDAFADTEGWKRIDRDGVSLDVRHEAHQSELRLERAGTGVLMTSSTLSTDQLADLAVGLIPAPEQSEI